MVPVFHVTVLRLALWLEQMPSCNAMPCLSGVLCSGGTNGAVWWAAAVSVC